MYHSAVLKGAVHNRFFYFCENRKKLDWIKFKNLFILQLDIVFVKRREHT